MCQCHFKPQNTTNTFVDQALPTAEAKSLNYKVGWIGLERKRRGMGEKGKEREVEVVAPLV